MKINREIERRRTFAIISHPDAGKTTLTEKLLLFGGAIHVAGAVKSNKIKRNTTSDFLEIERQRGISVATSVMTFEFEGTKINILDTPGHKDFAEDTYRTLTAVDSVILVVDRAKGVEEQTRKLMEVCRMRHTPVMIFINKMDREGIDNFELLENLEKELQIATCPLTWPIGGGKQLTGVYEFQSGNIRFFDNGKRNHTALSKNIKDLDDPEINQLIDEDVHESFTEEIELASDVFESFNPNLYLEGYLAPVFFGSALYNFGIIELLKTFIEFAPHPKPSETIERMVSPEEKEFSGFIFKIHANLDPNHRDRIAFLRVCSGKFERNKLYFHTRLKKKMRFASPATFMANNKSTVDEAYPGDVIGLYDNGSLKIGDTLTEGEALHFKGIPSFSPEILKEVINRDPFKTKQLEKGVRQLTDEGLAQLFIQQPGNKKIIGTVGELQFDVIKYRLENEYGAKCDFSTLPYIKAYWLASENKESLENLLKRKAGSVAFDKSNTPVFLAENNAVADYFKESYPDVRFFSYSESVI